MALERVSTYGTQQAVVRDFTSGQLRLANLQNQISSGYKASTYDELDGQVEQLSSLNDRIQSAKNYQESNTLILSRLKTTSKALDQTISIADNIKNLIVLRRSPNGDSLAFSQQMESLKKQLAATLNTNTEGRFIFGGTRTDTPPVTDPIPPTRETGTPDAGYYQGSAADVTARIDDGNEVTYNVRADDEGFQKLFAGIFEGLSGDSGSSGSDATLAHAYDLVQSGISRLTQVQATVNANVINVQQVNQKHAALETYYKGVAEEISKTDVLAASTQVSIEQGVLQATFQIFSRISNLRLSDFLK